MNGTVCILIISTFFINNGSKDLVNEERLVADESLCRITKLMTGKEIVSGNSIIRKEMSCECLLPDKNAVMIPTFVGQNKRIVRHKKR